MSDRIMYPGTLRRILYRAGGDSRLRPIDVGEVDGNTLGMHDKKYPRVGIYFQPSVCEQPVKVATAERDVLPAEHDFSQTDPWYTGKQYRRYSWVRTLRQVCGSTHIPRELRRKVWREAERQGYRDFLEKDTHKELVGA